MKSSKLRRQITENKSRVIVLVGFINSNIRHAAQSVEAGYFTKCADQFRDFADKCEEIAKLNGEIQQMSFDLERVEETPELPFQPVPTGSAVNLVPSPAHAGGGL